MLAKIEGRRRRGRQRMRGLDGIIDSVDMSSSKCWERVKTGVLHAAVKWDRKEPDRTEQLNNNEGCSTPRTLHTSSLSWLWKQPCSHHYLISFSFCGLSLTSDCPLSQFLSDCPGSLFRVRNF